VIARHLWQQARTQACLERGRQCVIGGQGRHVLAVARR
jgi:hypothetical protein